MSFKPIEVKAEELAYLEKQFPDLTYHAERGLIAGVINLRASLSEDGKTPVLYPRHQNPEGLVEDSYKIRIHLRTTYPKYASKGLGTPFVEIEPQQREKLAKRIEGELRLHMHIDEYGAVCLCEPTKEINGIRELMLMVVNSLYFTSYQSTYGEDPWESYPRGAKGIEQMMNEIDEGTTRIPAEKIEGLKIMLRRQRRAERKGKQAAGEAESGAARSQRTGVGSSMILATIALIVELALAAPASAAYRETTNPDKAQIRYVGQALADLMQSTAEICITRSTGPGQPPEKDARQDDRAGHYTDVVFEASDASGRFRAFCGGRRYDGMLSQLDPGAGKSGAGKAALPAVSFGFGDAVIVELPRA